MFEPDLDELEERVSEMGEMLRDLGGMVQKCRALNIDAVDALNLEFKTYQEDLEEEVKFQQKADMREYCATV